MGKRDHTPGMSGGFSWCSGYPRCAVWLLLATLSLPFAKAATLVVEPVADTSIYRGDGFDNISDGAGPHIWVATIAGGVTRRALVRFDLSAIPPGSQINSATLRIFQSRARDEHVVALHRLTRSWGESTSNGGDAGVGASAAPGDATWTLAFFPASSWTTPGGDFVSAASAQTDVGQQGGYYTWSSTAALVADIKAWVDSPTGNFGWIMIGDEVTEQNAKRISSRQSAFAPVRPTLTIDYTPPPVADDGDIPLPAWALVLLGGGLAAVLGRRRNSARRSRVSRKR